MITLLLTVLLVAGAMSMLAMGTLLIGRPLRGGVPGGRGR